MGGRMSIAKQKLHWIDPRSSIATSLKHNDIAYATHGALQAMQVLMKMGMPTRKETLLDYGCGTGRVGRCLTPLAKQVYGYDPVPQTIEHGSTEAAPLRFRNLTLTSNWDDVPEVDHGFSVNVMEHLSNDDAQEMIDHLAAKVRYGTVLYYNPVHNREVLYPYITDEERAEDAAMRANGSSVIIRLLRFRQGR